MPSWGDLLGKGSVAEQLLVWGVLNQILGTVLGPAMELVAEQVNSAHPVVPLTPAELADMVIRNIKTEAEGAREAALSGTDANRFHDQVLASGEPPGLEQVIEMWRRGFVGEGPDVPGVASVASAVRTSRLRPEWLEPILKMRDVPITVGEVVDALLRGQITREEAITEAGYSGINPDRLQVLLDSAGRPPSPMELVELYRRGEIPKEGVGPGVVSFQQGIFEGDAKDKWWTEYFKLTEYIPPPRTISTLYRTGSISAELAAELYQKAGLTPDLAAAYIHSASGEKMEGTVQLARGLVLELYQAGAIDASQAGDKLGKLGYGPAEQTFLLESADLHREVQTFNKAVNRVGTLYANHRVTRDSAVRVLGELGLTPAHVDKLMATWDLELYAEVKLPTLAEIGGALKNGAISAAEALTEAGRLGYQPWDAYVALSAHAGGPVGNKPSAAPVPPGVV